MQRCAPQLLLVGHEMSVRRQTANTFMQGQQPMALILAH